MIEKWYKMTSKERIQELLQEMIAKYYSRNVINLTDRSIIQSTVSNSDVTSKDFFRIGLYSNIPTSILKDSALIVGMDNIGASIAFGEHRVLVEKISEEVDSERLNKIEPQEIMRKGFNCGNPGVVFCPIELYKKIHEIIEYRWLGEESSMFLKGSDARFVFSNNLGKWNNIVFIGEKAIQWTRIVPPSLPPNLSDFTRVSQDTEPLLAAYKIDVTKWDFTVGSVSNIEIIDSSSIKVLTPPELE